jgi:hypothetical protein
MMRKHPIALALILAIAGSSPAAPATDPATLRTAVSAEELRRILPGHFIDERPYPCDGGPMMFNADGTFLSPSGNGDYDGRYIIADGMVTLDGKMGGTMPWKSTIRFAKDGNGKLYLTDTDPDREFKLAPIDRHTRWITCGNDSEPPPPPGNAG